MVMERGGHRGALARLGGQAGGGQRVVPSSWLCFLWLLEGSCRQRCVGRGWMSALATLWSSILAVRCSLAWHLLRSICSSQIRWEMVALLSLRPD